MLSHFKNILSTFINQNSYISSKPKCYFMKIPLKNKGIDSNNIGNILHNKLICIGIPPWYGNVEVLSISYKYTSLLGNMCLW